MYYHLSTEWSLFKMFSRTLTEACPLASSSKVYVDITDNPEVKQRPWILSICFVMICHLIIFHCSFQSVRLSVMLFVQQGELFELSPATPLLSQAVVLGDRRTYSVYDLTRAETFGQLRSLNLLLRWKGDSGMNELNWWCPCDGLYPDCPMIAIVKLW